MTEGPVVSYSRMTSFPTGTVSYTVTPLIKAEGINFRALAVISEKASFASFLELISNLTPPICLMQYISGELIFITTGNPRREAAAAASSGVWARCFSGNLNP